MYIMFKKTDVKGVNKWKHKKQKQGSNQVALS